MNVKMTFARVHSRAVVVNDKIWIIGGMSSTLEPVKAVEIIDTKTMTWTTAPSMNHSSQISHCHWFLKNEKERERKKERKKGKRNGEI